MSGVKGRSGARKEPIEKRIRRGTLKPSDVTIVASVVEMETPTPPRPLGSIGRGVWEWAWRHGAWLQPADQELLLMACEMHDERAAARTRYLGDTEEFWRSGIMARKLEELIKAHLVELGFSPASRASMNLAVASTVEKVARVQQPAQRRAMTL